MNDLTTRLDTILHDPMAPARAHGAGVGYVGFDFPQDLAFALDAPCLHLPWQADRATPFADQWLESGFPGWARSIVEDWGAGRFDCLRTVVFSRGDDASHRLYYYLRELQRRGRLAGPEPQVLDVARIPRDSSRRHTRDALATTAAALGVDATAWQSGIRRANALRDGFAALAASGLQGEQVNRLARASLFADVTSLLGDAAALAVATPRLRVLLAGSAPPDERLHDAVARAGGEVVAQLHGYAPARIGERIDPASADVIGAVADAVRASSGPRSFVDPARSLTRALDASRADAIVLWLTREDEALAWHVPALRSASAASGKPSLQLTARRWDGSDGALAEIESFVEKQLR